MQIGTKDHMSVYYLGVHSEIRIKLESSFYTLYAVDDHNKEVE